MHQVSRAREAELEASGRASALQQFVDVLRQQNEMLSRQNEMLLQRAFQQTGTGPVYPASASLPPILGGRPLGSPSPPTPVHYPDVSDIGFPVPPGNGAQARRGDAGPLPPGYEMGGLDQISFADMGDEAAAQAGIADDELTGSLVGDGGNRRRQ